MVSQKEIQKNSDKLLNSLANLSEEELSKLVLYHNKKYFVDNDPEITDEAFDMLVEALRLKNSKSPALLSLGQEASNIEKFGSPVIHKKPMLSLDKCYDDETFFKWAKKINGRFITMPKIDGVACSITYDDGGKFKQAATRGDGKIGDDISRNVRAIKDLPLKLPKEIYNIAKEKDSLEVRGEVYLSLSRFNEYYKDEFVNPRNLAAGALKHKQVQKSKSYGLCFFPYDLGGVSISTEEEKFILLKKANFKMMPWSIVDNDEHATQVFRAFEKNRDTYDFEIDGVVYRANDLKEQRRLGQTAHHPRYALAYKFAGQSSQTKLREVIWSVARSGIITPVAKVKPVFVGGATISRVSLHNYSLFLKHDLHEHSLIEINRRGGVIPYLERVLSRKGKEIKPPTTCPSCKGPVRVSGEFLFCQNPESCENVAVAKLIHFCQSLDLEGFGEKLIKRLHSAGMLNKLGDFFRLRKEDLLEIERMGDKLAKKLINEINKKREIELPTFIKALGIPEIGNTVAQLLAKNFYTLDRILTLKIEELIKLHGIGEKTAELLVNGLSYYKDEIKDLLNEVKVKNYSAQRASVDKEHPLFDKSVLFTGKMAHLARKDAQELVRKKGGRAPDSMSGQIDYLVIGDEGSPLLGDGKKSTKHKEAEKMQKEGRKIKIISESKFLKIAE